MISISLNDKQLEVSGDTTLTTLMEQLNQSHLGIAIAVNEIVISKNSWKSTTLKPNDKVLLIKATQGG